MLELTTDDLVGFPIWRFEGVNDEHAVVFPASSFENPEKYGYIARTRFVLADGSEWWGYCSPTDDSGLDYLQPVIIAPEGVVRFWYDDVSSEAEPAHACLVLGKQPHQIFPAQFECVVAFEGQHVAGVLRRVEMPNEPVQPTRPKPRG